MRGRASFSVLAVLLLGGVLLWALTPTAGADVSGPCTGTLNGVDAASLSTPATALEVPEDGSIAIAYVSSDPITGHEVGLEFAGFSWIVDEGVDDGNSWVGTVEVADYSKYGVGLYKVNAVTSGAGVCRGEAYVKVTGRSPLTTAAGVAGAVATGIGAIGMAGVAVSSTRKPGLLDGIMSDVERVELPPPDPYSAQEIENQFERHARCLGCWSVIPLAILRTSAYMLVGAGGMGVPVPVIRWRPLISLASLVSSVLAGLGTLVLSQQYAVLYPSRVVTVAWFAGWLALGIVVPSLTRLVGIRKANVELAAAASRRWT